MDNKTDSKSIWDRLEVCRVVENRDLRFFKPIQIGSIIDMEVEVGASDHHFSTPMETLPIGEYSSVELITRGIKVIEELKPYLLHLATDSELIYAFVPVYLVEKVFNELQIIHD